MSHQLDHPRDDPSEPGHESWSQGPADDGWPSAAASTAVPIPVPQQASPPADAAAPTVGPSWVRARGVGVGWDGSGSSWDAVRWAAVEAASRRCPLTVLHAAGTYATWLDPAAHPDVPALVRELSSSGAQAALDALEQLHATGHAGTPEVRVGRTTALVGPQDHLLECSEDLDVLVIGNRDRGELTAAVQGSVPFAVAARSSCPVVVVRGDEPVRPGPDAPVVLGFDGSPGCLAAARFAAEQAERADAELLVVIVVEPGTDHGRGLQGSGTALLRRLQTDHPALRASLLVRRGDPVPVLLGEGARAGLAVVGSRGLSRRAALVLGSTSLALVHGSRRPVAVVREGTTR